MRGVIGLVAAVPFLFMLWHCCLKWELDPDFPSGWLYMYREHKNRVPFEAEAWRAFRRNANTNEWPFRREVLPIRLRMVDDLLARYDFKGWHREQVESLLGPGTKTIYFHDLDLVYYLGPGRYGNAVGDSEWLLFRFDSEGKVTECLIDHN
jgi:hypothetical protein